MDNYALSENAERAPRGRRPAAAALFCITGAPTTAASGDGISPVRPAAKRSASRSPELTFQTTRNPRCLGTGGARRFNQR